MVTSDMNTCILWLQSESMQDKWVWFQPDLTLEKECLVETEVLYSWA